MPTLATYIPPHKSNCGLRKGQNYRKKNKTIPDVSMKISMNAEMNYLVTDRYTTSWITTSTKKTILRSFIYLTTKSTTIIHIAARYKLQKKYDGTPIAVLILLTSQRGNDDMGARRGGRSPPQVLGYARKWMS